MSRKKRNDAGAEATRPEEGSAQLPNEQLEQAGEELQKTGEILAAEAIEAGAVPDNYAGQELAAETALADAEQAAEDKEEDRLQAAEQADGPLSDADRALGEDAPAEDAEEVSAGEEAAEGESAAEPRAEKTRRKREPEELARRTEQVKTSAEQAAWEPAAPKAPPRKSPAGRKPGAKKQSQRRQQHGPMGGGGPAAMMPGEKAQDFRGTMGKLFRYLGGYLPAIIVCFVLAAGSAVFAIFGPKVMAGATDELFSGLLAMITGTGGIDFNIVGSILLTCVGIYVISAILQYVQGLLLVNISNKVSYRLRRELSEKINKLPLSYFDHESYGNVLSRITNDVDTLTQTMTQSLPSIVSGIATIVGVLIMMFTMNVWMALITFLILPVSMLLVMRIVKYSQPMYMQQQNYLGEANGQVEEMFGGHLVVKAFNHEEKSNADFGEVNDRLYKAAWKSQFFGGMMMPVMNFVSNVGYVVVCIAGGFFVLSGSITVGSIQAFIQYVRTFTQPITQIANASNVMQQTAAAAERVFNFLGEEEEVPDPAEPVQPENVEGSVYFAHVSFGYVPEKTIIHDFSAVIEPGKTIAIVGPTGAGKTTMVKLLMRFYDVNSGAILVDEYDLKQFARGDLRGMFGMVLQDTWLYNDTIMENIRYGRLDATDEEVVAAAKAAQADRFIRTLPDGYHMVLNEEASNISQGQKQLLTIARTILADPRIMILDEATSSVDTRTEVAIQKAMKTLMEGRTSFIIAHRLSTIRDADMILVMRDGDIVETGTHTELLEAGGFYAELYNSQFETGITA